MEQIRITNIVRLHDSLPLVSGQEPASQDNGTRLHKQQLKKIINSLAQAPVKDPEVAVPLGDVYVMYLVSSNVLYSGIFEKSYPQSMASAYLSELKKEFEKLYDERRLNGTSNAFAFMEFESFIEKTKKVFLQNKASQKLSQVSGNLAEIHRVMTRSLSEVVSRGDDIEQLSQKSELVLVQSDEYRKVSIELNRAKWWQKWGALLAIGVFVFLVYYVRRFF